MFSIGILNPSVIAVGRHTALYDRHSRCFLLLAWCWFAFDGISTQPYLLLATLGFVARWFSPFHNRYALRLPVTAKSSRNIPFFTATGHQQRAQGPAFSSCTTSVPTSGSQPPSASLPPPLAPRTPTSASQHPTGERRDVTVVYRRYEMDCAATGINRQERSELIHSAGRRHSSNQLSSTGILCLPSHPDVPNKVPPEPPAATSGPTSVLGLPLANTAHRLSPCLNRSGETGDRRRLRSVAKTNLGGNVWSRGGRWLSIGRAGNGSNACRLGGRTTFGDEHHRRL
ncbi:unnamed protein product [Tilletia laevis]|uniref:Uncharacterized protein n=2 Tax=Tilletia TaxID=13289 RepID=A0A177T3D9_9BASI|nr:hypothetical protein CF336_g9363 [Tilletia laevis]KAE8236822.1 hypothetical protein A4X03_0g9315 [Tilletia caries]KAE8180603.1 hypothetical protein CF335_g9192 [Tilletia laevis]CAD6902024.1 unnamed protein product [Tilletia caries]CAD6932205.1 unnamed protein product [Tilletia laevis]